MSKQEKYSKNAEKQSENYQKKLAEQLSSKTTLTSKEIEEGVEKFIQKSQDSISGVDLKPPYWRPVWYEKFFKIIQQRNVSTFSLEFISLNITNARSEAYKFQSGLRFLHLVDLKGNTTPELEKLKVKGITYEKNLAEIVRKAYSSLFDAVIVESAEPENIVNFMIEKYGFSQPLAEAATNLFVYFCNKAHISISKELATYKPKIERNSEKKRVTQKKQEKNEGSMNKDDFDGDSFASLKSQEFMLAVKKELPAIQLAKSQIIAFLDYWIEKLRDEKESS